MPRRRTFGHEMLLLLLGVGGGACRVSELDLHGRPCGAEGICLDSFTCDGVDDRCVTDGDPCADEGRLLACRAGDTSCSDGCRRCSAGLWTVCAPPPSPQNPVLLGVANICFGQAAEITWVAESGLDYAVEIWRGSSWGAPDTLTRQSASAVDLPAASNYRWRVRAFNQALTADWAESAAFGVLALPNNPALSGVGDLCLGAAATVNWTPMTGGLYTVELWDLGAWLPPIDESNGTASRTGLTVGEGYKWRIRTEVAGCAADWTESALFAVRLLPDLLELRNSTTTTSASSFWNWRADRCGAQTIAVRRGASIPANPSDGVSATSVTQTSFSDQGLIFGTLYYYGIFVTPAGLTNATRQAVVAVVPNRTSVNPVRVRDSTPGAPLFVIDGQDDDLGWLDVPELSFSFLQRWVESGGADPTIEGYLRFAWDSDNLYLFLSLADRYVHVDPSGGGEYPWTNDAVELFFDVDFDRDNDLTPDADDFQLIFTADGSATFFGQGTGVDAYFPEWTPSPALSFTAVVDGTLNDESDTDNGWRLELAVPLAALGLAGLSPPRTIGFSFTVDEDDLYGHTTQHAYPWNENAEFNNASTWGTCQF